MRYSPATRKISSSKLRLEEAKTTILTGAERLPQSHRTSYTIDFVEQPCFPAAECPLSTSASCLRIKVVWAAS